MPALDLKCNELAGFEINPIWTATVFETFRYPMLKLVSVVTCLGSHILSTLYRFAFGNAMPSFKYGYGMQMPDSSSLGIVESNNPIIDDFGSISATRYVLLFHTNDSYETLSQKKKLTT